MFLSKIAKFFSKNNKIEQNIPTYPPFVEGLPYASIEKLLSDQKQLLMELKQASGLNPQEYNTYLLPVIRRYAEYTHLLPASQANHHRHAGGLFHHGLDTALKAARRSDSQLFMNYGSPTEKKKGELVWRTAAIIGGLIHDIGKPVADMTITNDKNDQIWNPHEETLVHWLEINNYSRYWVTWRPKRFKKHMSPGNIPANIIPDTTKIWMHGIDPEINGVILNTITEGDDTSLTEIVHGADIDSTSEDMNKYGSLPNNGELGIPLGRLIIEYMVQLIEESVWKVNEAGGRVWVTEEGVFVVWKQAVQDINKKIKKEKIKGIPKAADSIAKHLIDHNLAESNDMQIYWTVKPAILKTESREVSLSMLKIASPELLFPTRVPDITKAKIGEEDNANIAIDDIIKTTSSSTNTITPKKENKQELIKKRALSKGITITTDETTPQPTIKVASPVAVEPVIINTATATEKKSKSVQIELPATQNKTSSNNDNKTPLKTESKNINSMFDGIAEDSAKEQGNPFSTAKGKTQKSRPSNNAKPSIVPIVKGPSKNTKTKIKANAITNKEKITLPLENRVEAKAIEEATPGSELKNTLIHLNAKAANLFFIEKNRIHIKKTWKNATLNIEPNELMIKLDKEEYLYVDPRKPSMKSFIFKGAPVLILNNDISEELNEKMRINKNNNHPTSQQKTPKNKKTTQKTQQPQNKKKAVEKAKPVEKPKNTPKKNKNSAEKRITKTVINSQTLDEECKKGVAQILIKLMTNNETYENIGKKVTKKSIILSIEIGNISRELAEITGENMSAITRGVQNCSCLQLLDELTLELKL